MTPDQLPAGLPMDDKIEAWRHGLLRLVLQHARAYADNSDPAKTEAAYVAICDYLRTTPEGFVLVETKSLATAYGHLWHVNAGADAPAGIGVISTTPERAAYAARKLLREALTSEQRGIGINASRALLAASQESGT